MWVGDADPVRRFPYRHWAGHRGSSKVSKLRLCSLRSETASLLVERGSGNRDSPFAWVEDLAQGWTCTERDELADRQNDPSFEAARRLVSLRRARFGRGCSPRSQSERGMNVAEPAARLYFSLEEKAASVEIPKRYLRCGSLWVLSSIEPPRGGVGIPSAAASLARVSSEGRR